MSEFLEFENKSDRTLEWLLNEVKAGNISIEAALKDAQTVALDKLQPNAEMKAEMIGESFIETDIPCGECGGPGQDCVACDGEGEYPFRVDVPWSMQKQIWQQMNAIAARQIRENARESQGE